MCYKIYTTDHPVLSPGTVNAALHAFMLRLGAYSYHRAGGHDAYLFSLDPMPMTFFRALKKSDRPDVSLATGAIMTIGPDGHTVSRMFTNIDRLMEEWDDIIAMRTPSFSAFQRACRQWGHERSWYVQNACDGDFSPVEFTVCDSLSHLTHLLSSGSYSLGAAFILPGHRARNVPAICLMEESYDEAGHYAVLVQGLKAPDGYMHSVGRIPFGQILTDPRRTEKDRLIHAIEHIRLIQERVPA